MADFNDPGASRPGGDWAKSFEFPSRPTPRCRILVYSLLQITPAR
jgi:hypothetical protein